MTATRERLGWAALFGLTVIASTFRGSKQPVVEVQGIR
jgi:hypothetical protein